MFIVNKTVRGHYTISGGGGGVLEYLFIYIFSIRLGGALKMANLIRPSLGLQIYDLFREEPARSFISKIIHPPPPPPPRRFNGGPLEIYRQDYSVKRSNLTSSETILNGYSVKIMLYKTPSPWTGHLSGTGDLVSYPPPIHVGLLHCIS